MSREMREKDGSGLLVRGASGRDGSLEVGMVVSIPAVITFNKYQITTCTHVWY